ncbi:MULTISPECIES: FKBP-type peptidyl-prolyl cis-trans isomerase [unclassified Modestobacter]|uniref:FKBP-type peptidyl-prolyl cis-trans isomerase n=1 Tax=unclassified Modestobacter TaxID=2643866 RepID=UPI0022AAD4FF|nr:MULTISPECIES: FKBP-type peptidyl-prolyl cis-trans isomerase [unclassified Modestobacter]MCZ2825388.1 FKBP-type peptidyl-prolyl cis-trans isomerase [Modestobacter sp. VKM Ac-2981]MCZ2853547.1 FKBP-type peptidyl-prolyl cis-trans isomerase [Modestobacter sp. VKM Ac-2982]
MSHRTVRRTLLAVPLSIALSLPLAACASDDPAEQAEAPVEVEAPTEDDEATAVDEEPVEEVAAEVSTDLSVRPEVPPSDAPAPTELVTEDVVVGDGAEATVGSTAQVKYVGAFYGTGEEFDASWDRGEDETLPVPLGAGRVIPGFEQGIVGMQVGGRRVITIPSDLAYGDQPPAGIPVDADLVFVVDLVSVD